MCVCVCDCNCDCNSLSIAVGTSCVEALLCVSKQHRPGGTRRRRRKSKRLGMGGERVKDGEKDRGKRERGLQWRVFGMSGKRRICEEEWSGERRPV